MMPSEDHSKSVILKVLLGATKLSIIAISIVMVFVTLAQVVFRYVISAPLPWSEELARYCFVWIVFLGGALGLARGIHLGVDLFVNSLHRRSRKSLQVFVTFLIAGFALVVLINSFPVLQMNLMQRSPALGLQMAWVYLAIPVSMGLIVLISLERLVIIVRGFKNIEDE